jgi:ribosome-binding protein aMBF1 (putative translation factor)
MTGNPSEAGVQPRGRRAAKVVEPTGRNLGRRASQGARKTDDLDLLIGRRLRQRRVLLAISQEELARRIGLSFQQLQKYEVGENRISAARLFKLSEILAVPISWFFRPAMGRRLTGIPEGDSDDE